MTCWDSGTEPSPPLPEVASELTAINDILHGEIMLDDKFTEASMRETLLKRYPVVHIATHFRFLPGDESKSFLLLGDGSHLSLKELRTFRISSVGCNCSHCRHVIPR